MNSRLRTKQELQQYMLILAAPNLCQRWDLVLRFMIKAKTAIAELQEEWWNFSWWLSSSGEEWSLSGKTNRIWKFSKDIKRKDSCRNHLSTDEDFWGNPSPCFRGYFWRLLSMLSSRGNGYGKTPPLNSSTSQPPPTAMWACGVYKYRYSAHFSILRFDQYSALHSAQNFTYCGRVETTTNQEGPKELQSTNTEHSQIIMITERMTRWIKALVAARLEASSVHL